MFDPIFVPPVADPTSVAYITLALVAAVAIGSLIAMVWMAKNFTPWIQSKFLAADGALERLRGQTGRTTTLLNPSGKARFGGLEIRVRAVDILDIDHDVAVEVVDVQGDRVMVKQVIGSALGATVR